MSDHWRLGVVERSVLEALDAMDARPDRPHRKCARIVHQLADELGVSPRYGYDALCNLAQPWLQQIALVDFHGNNGSLDDPPANPRYTEARLSRAGAIALAAERGEAPKVPVALTNGDLHVDGLAPPFSPTRVIAALRAIIDNHRVTDAEIVDRVGPPESPTGCRVACDTRALAAGEPAEMIMTAELKIEPTNGGDAIVISNLPLRIGVDTVTEALRARVDLQARLERDAHPERFAELALPLRDLRDNSRSEETRIVCVVRAGADAGEVEAQIASTWGVRTRTRVQLAAPLPQLMRELVDDDPTAQRRALATLSDCLGS